MSGPSAEKAVPTAVDRLRVAMHAERAEHNTRDIDCWACEASQSASVKRLIDQRDEALAAARAMREVLDMAVPDEDAQANLWRTYWRGRIDVLHALGDTRVLPPGGSDA